MIDPSSFIENSRLLTELFGEWPSFHDAEVHAVDLWRGDICPERDSWVGPILNAKIQVLEATQRGAKHAGNDTLVTLRFHDVDHLELREFNHQNAILHLSFEHEPRGEGLTPYIRVEFRQAHGIHASFVCLRIEVIGAEPYSRGGSAVPAGLIPF
jgi:hypothetical protein